MINLNPSQLESLKSWTATGDSISDIQKKLQSEFGLNLTFMDTRFLLDDLELAIQSKEVEKEKSKDDTLDITKQKPADSTQGVQVEVSPIQEPGFLASGSVTFTDGIEARWYLNSAGQLELKGPTRGYRPPKEDVEDFQRKLYELLQGRF